MNKWNFKKAAFMFGMTVFLSAGIKASSSAKTEELKIADINFKNKELIELSKKADLNRNGYLSNRERNQILSIKINNPGSQKDLDLALETFPKAVTLIWNTGHLTSLHVNGEIHVLFLHTTASSQVKLTGNFENLRDMRYIATGSKKYNFNCNENIYTDTEDLSLTIAGKQIQGIHMSDTKVKFFNIDNCINLKKFTVENCSSLKTIYIRKSGTNFGISTGVIDSCDALSEFIARKNRFKKIGKNGFQFTSCSKLKKIYFSSTCTIEQLEVPDLENLNTLHCKGCDLKKLDVPKTINLQELYCNNNSLKTLDVSKLKNLKKLDCGNNKLKNIDISKNQKLTTLKCNGNKLKNLSISKNPKLLSLNYANAQIKNLSLKKNSALLRLNCSGNHLKTLNLKANKKLQYLNCSNNSLKKISLKSNKKLKNLNCKNNKLKNLSLKSNKKLEILRCIGNQFSQIDISHNKNLKEMYINTEYTFLKSFFKNKSNNYPIIYMDIKKNSLNLYKYAPVLKKAAIEKLDDFSDDNITIKKGMVRVPSKAASKDMGHYMVNQGKIVGERMSYIYVTYIR